MPRTNRATAKVSPDHDVHHDPLDALLRQAIRRAFGTPWEGWLRALQERGDRAASNGRPVPPRKAVR
jgi:hypothetical protein